VRPKRTSDAKDLRARGVTWLAGEESAREGLAHRGPSTVGAAWAFTVKPVADHVDCDDAKWVGTMAPDKNDLHLLKKIGFLKSKLTLWKKRLLITHGIVGNDNCSLSQRIILCTWSICEQIRAEA